MEGKLEKKTRKRLSRKTKEWEESICNHIGKIIDNATPMQLAEISLMAGLAWLGYDATKDLRGSLAGVLGYKLATTMGGTPPVSQIAGLAILAYLGLTDMGRIYQESREGGPIWHLYG